MMSEMPNLKAKYREEVAPALMQKFNYKSTMQIPRIEKIGRAHVRTPVTSRSRMPSSA